MAVYDLEEQEQISEIKAWWEQYGKLVTALAVAAAVASVSWQGWRWYENKQAAEAGALFHAVQQAVEKGETQRAREATGELIGRYGRTTYPQLAALLSAATHFERGDLVNARSQLEWAAEKGRDEVLRDIARLRLATLMLHEGKADEALAQLARDPAPALQGRFADLRGDVLLALGRGSEARTAYQAALDGFAGEAEGAATMREVVRIKLEAVEG